MLRYPIIIIIINPEKGRKTAHFVNYVAKVVKIRDH